PAHTADESCPACGYRARWRGRRVRLDIFSCNECEFVFEVLNPIPGEGRKTPENPGNFLDSERSVRDDVTSRSAQTHDAHGDVIRGRGGIAVVSSGSAAGSTVLKRSTIDASSV